MEIEGEKSDTYMYGLVRYGTENKGGRRHDTSIRLLIFTLLSRAQCCGHRSRGVRPALVYGQTLVHFPA